MKLMNKLVLLRHGQSQWNLENKFTGWKEVPLTSQGVNEARNAGRLIRKNNIKIDNIFSSNLKRANNTAEIAIKEANIGFLMAPLYHKAMKHVGGPRIELGTRTIFNLLGPLTNPAGVKNQFSGAFSKDWIVPMATVLRNLGTECAWVVHGSDGLDELTTTGSSFVAELKNGVIKTFEVSPEDAGIARTKPENLVGGDPDVNAKALMAVLNGEHGPYRDVVLFNTAAALLIAQKAEDLKDGVARAAYAIDNGDALKTLERLIAITNL